MAKAVELRISANKIHDNGIRSPNVLMKNITSLFDLVHKLEEFAHKEERQPIKITITHDQLNQLRLLQSEHKTKHFDYQRLTFHEIPVEIGDRFELQ